MKLITAISSSKEKSLSISKNKLTKQYINTPINPGLFNQIAFKGNLTKVGKNLLGDVGSNLGKKITRLSEESLDSIKSIIRKIIKENDLPFATKPLIAATKNDESIISKSLSLLSDDKVPEANKAVIRVKLAELRVMQRTPQNLTPNSATSLDIANMHAENAKGGILELIDTSKAAIEKAGHSVGYGDVDPKTGKLTYSGSQKVSHPKKSLHNHDDFNTSNDASHGAGQNDKTTFKGDASDVDYVDSSNIGESELITDFSPKNTELLGDKPSVFNVVSDRPAFSGTILEHSTAGSELAEVIADAGEKHEIASDLLDNLSNIAEKLSDVPGLEEAAEALIVVKFLPAIKHLANEEYEEALIKGGTRLAETFILPVKWAKMGAGAIKGFYLKASRISSEGAGAFKGAKQAMKKWTKGRKELEDDILGISKLSPAEILEKKQKALEEAKQTAVANVNAKAQIKLDNLNHDTNQQLQAIDANTEIVKESAAFDMKKVQYLKSNIEDTERQVNSELESIKIKLNELLLEKESISNKHTIKVEDFSKQIEDAKQKNNLELQKSLESKLQDLQKDFLKKSEALVARINQFRQRVDLYAKLDSISSARGFNKIAGYNKQKKILVEHFQALINKEKAGENVAIPGAILFFGPKGNGKTTFASAFAEELNCHPVKLITTLNPELDYFKIEEAAIDAEKYYQKTGTRTILLMDEFDIFAHKTGNYTSKLKKLIEKISKEYHCTIFATTNAPEDVAVELLKGKMFYKAGLAPANKSNAMSILKHYAASFAEEGVDFNSLANDIVKTQPNEAYSNARISNIVKTLLKDENNVGRKLTQEDLKHAIECKGPDIKNDALELFATQLKYCRDLTENSHTDIKIVKDIPVLEEFSSRNAALTNNDETDLNYLQESAAKKLDSYSEQLISELELPNKQFAKSVFPELSLLISDSDELKEILKLITPENKDFVTNQALPTILKNAESLDLEHSISSILRVSTPDNIDSLEKFADNIDRFNIKNSDDVVILLNSITKENKDFAFNELFPYLVENSEKYKIIRGGQMAEYLEAITPENMEFMLNEAIPSILECADVLMLNASDIASIAKHLTRGNIENLKIIAENTTKFDIYGKWNQLDIGKLVGYLKKSTQELSENI